MSRGLLQDEYYDCNIGVAWVIHHWEPQSVSGLGRHKRGLITDHWSAPIRLNKYPCRSPDTPRAPRDSPPANRTSGHIDHDIAWTSFSPRCSCWGCYCRWSLGADLWLAFCWDYWSDFYSGFCWLRMMDWGGDPGPRWRGTGCWSASCSPETSETGGCDEAPGGLQGWWWTSGGLSSSTRHLCQCCPQTTGWTFFSWLVANPLISGNYSVNCSRPSLRFSCFHFDSIEEGTVIENSLSYHLNRKLGLHIHIGAHNKSTILAVDRTKPVIGIWN